jgi:hypothetical protein
VSNDPAKSDAWTREHLAGWPPASRELAEQLIAKYGKPHEVTARALAWHGNGPWKRTVLHRDGVKHNFPLPHEDLLEQTIDYRVPSNKLGDLVSYDGSLVFNRTRGELCAYCENEAQNTLMLNLANDIVTGERTMDEALAYHAQVVRGLQTHVPEAYPQQLKFKPQPASQTADPAHEAELLEHLQSDGR